MDYSKLSAQQFEVLCGRLLKASGRELLVQSAKGQDIGVDYTFRDDKGCIWVVEVKHLAKSRLGTSALQSSATQLSAVMQLMKVDKGLLIVSILLPQELKKDIEERENVVIWDSSKINKLLEKHPEINKEFYALISAQNVALTDIDQGKGLDSRAQELISRLEALKPGHSTYRQFEDLCVEILNYVFIPELSVPSVQSKSDDELDIRDAVYPIPSDQRFWQEIKRLSFTRFMVAEFKNYSDKISQKEVESIQQYLYDKARRMFGVLCSRKQPSESALRARRRAWVESDKLILFLSDEELKNIIRAKSYGDSPTDVLEAQLDDFFLKLVP